LAFAARYGPWAIVAGASEGVGRELARSLAAKGVHCVLVARRVQPLAELAEQIRAESGVECLPASIDLAAPDAFDGFVAAVGCREVGLYVGNAGADANGSRFLEREIETWDDLVRCNVLTTMRACHHFGALMRERRRGGCSSWARAPPTPGPSASPSIRDKGIPAAVQRIPLGGAATLRR